MVNYRLLYYQLSQAALPVECVDINGRIDYTRALTPAEEATAAQVIAAHDPNGLLPEEQDAQDYRNARQAAIILLDSGIAGWDALTANQKQAWLGTNFKDIMRIVRALIKITT